MRRRDFTVSNQRQQASHVYRCVYCRQRIHDYTVFAQHEMHCQAKAVMLTYWADLLYRAKRREAAG